MMKTKRELRAMPLHELVDHLEATWLLWRFSGTESALEGSLGAAFWRVACEVDRRRRRAITGSCTCMLCCQLAWNFEEQE